MRRWSYDEGICTRRVPEYPLLAIHVRMVLTLLRPMTWKEYLPSGVTVARYALSPAAALHCSRSVRTFRCFSVSGAEGGVVAHDVSALAINETAVVLALLGWGLYYARASAVTAAAAEKIRNINAPMRAVV